MSLRVNHNIPATTAYGELVGVSARFEKSVERLSSGLRINRAADDAAGLTISEKLRRQVRGLARATMNAQDGISMIQSAEGALNETHSILNRMRELAVQSANDTLTSNDRLEIQKEVLQLRDDINRIAHNTEFNTKKLLDGSQSAEISTSSGYARGLVSGAASEGGDYQVSLALLQGGSAQLQRTCIFMSAADGRLASGDSMLVSVAQFYNANGVFLLDEPQTLTLNGNGRSAEVVVDAYTTLDNLSSLIQGAMSSQIDGLGITSSTAGLVATAQTMVAGLGGYLEINSGYIGEKGRISFAGPQELIDACGFSTVRAARDNLVEVALTDRDKKVRTTQIDCDRASGLLNGIDIQFDSQAAQVAGSRGLVEGLLFSGSESFTVEAGGQFMNLVVASGYSTLEGIARSFNMQIATGPLAINGLSAAVFDGEIRLAYQRPASAMQTVASNIKISYSHTSNVLGFNNGVYGGSVDSSKNRDKSVWGFSKYQAGLMNNDIAAIEVSDSRNSTILVLAEAMSDEPGVVTVADMIAFSDLQAKFNADLQNAGVAVRVDQIDNSMVFTSTRIGRENVGDAVAWSSVVSIEVVKSTVIGSVMSAGTSFLRYFGITAGSKGGVGDTNFRMHVADRDNQYHIGANQGEVMKVSFSEMTARALGVDNLDLTTIAGAEKAMGKLNKAIDMVSAERSKLGAYQNRMEYAITNLRSMNTNAAASESRIRDTDIASEMIEITRNQV
ncbi:MAG TPA: flagellin, partial [Candidatus Rifleibacterium sp.]|nr:flagellin [Candidatus Rifleibacterium sp.]